jgi:hypothetical protein
MVNLLLVPVFHFLEGWAHSSAMASGETDLWMLLRTIEQINLVLLVFNMLPVYPLDGGQILRSLLWFPLGPAKSLYVASIIGFAGVAGLAGIAIWYQDIWIGVIAAFVFMNCKRGWQRAQAMIKVAAIPTHREFACPACKEAPPVGEFWSCVQCQTLFDTFVTNAKCPNCSAEFLDTQCVRCGQVNPIADWRSRRDA